MSKEFHKKGKIADHFSNCTNHNLEKNADPARDSFIVINPPSPGVIEMKKIYLTSVAAACLVVGFAGVGQAQQVYDEK